MSIFLFRRFVFSQSKSCSAPGDYIGHKASLVQDMYDTINNCLSCLSPPYAIVFVYLKYKMSDHVF